jgi:4'-phosphopantetheinyl transferase
VIGAGTVELRAVALAVPDADVAGARALLSADERERADRFVFARDARRFIVCRAALRSALAEHVGADPREIAFEYSPYGKPRLPGPRGPSFNVSHSGELAVIALAAGRELGVDVEQCRRVRDCLRLAELAFSPLERARLAALPAADRDDAFLVCWTRKEAFAKACGDGLSRPLDRFTVAFGPQTLARVVHVDDDPAEPGRWWLAELQPAPGFVGTLAARGAPAEIVWIRTPA